MRNCGISFYYDELFTRKLFIVIGRIYKDIY
jgi:hypothetical protein